MRPRWQLPVLLLLGVGGIFFLAGMTLSVLWRTDAGVRGTPLHVTRVAAVSAPPVDAPRHGRLLRYWAGDRLRSDISYRDDLYDGEYRTCYESGAPYELRHYRLGQEEGVQQSWTEDGVLYLNYEVRDGRRFGLVNPSPCNTVGDASGSRSTSDTGRDQRGRKGQAGQPELARSGENDSTGLPYYDDASFTPRWTPAPHAVASFSFDTQRGGTISDAQLAGHPYVASFIYTQCAAVCPILVTQLSRVARAIDPAQAHIVSFSVTPETDTPEALARFGRARGIDARKWSLVTGPKRDIYLLARESFFADDARIGSAADDETAFLHTEKLLLVDARGHLRGVYNGTQPHAVDQLIGDLATLTAGHERLDAPAERRGVR